MKYRGRRDFMSQLEWTGEPRRVVPGIVGGGLLSGRSM
jgi:hypothetical protein